MTSHRKRSSRAPSNGIAPSASLPIDQVSAIYRDIEACYEQSRTSCQKKYKLLPESNWLYYGTTIGPPVALWTLALLLESWFPGNKSILYAARVFYYLGYAPYVVSTVIVVMRAASIISKSVKSGALGDFERTKTRSTIESRFVDEITAKYSANVRHFTITGLQLQKNELESWPKHVASSFGGIAVVLAFVGASGFFTSVLVPESVKTANPWLTLFQWGAMILLLLFVLSSISDSFERVQAFKRVIRLVRFSVGDVEGVEDATDSDEDMKVEIKSEGTASDQTPVPAVDNSTKDAQSSLNP